MGTFHARAAARATRPVRFESLEGRTLLSAGDVVWTTTTDFVDRLTDQLVGMALAPDGKIVAGGFSTTNSIPPRQQFALARYNPDGSLDTSFDGDGKLSTFINGEDASAYDVAVQADRKIVAVGLTTGGTSFLSRYNEDGTLDTTFAGGAGMLWGAVPARAVVIQPDGKILAAGASGPSTSQDFLLTRYTPDGTPDATFGSGGSVTTDFGGGNDTVYGIALSADGKIVVSGSSFQGTSSTAGDWAIARYDGDGSLDSTFGTGGKVVKDFFGRSDFGAAPVVQPDGKVVVAGTYQRSDATFVRTVARYNADGTPDTSFGTGGLADYSASTITRPALQPDGKIVVPGQVNSGGHNFFAVTRYNADGSPDNSFGSGGQAAAQVGLNGGAVRVLVLPNGKLVAGGTAFSAGPPAHEDFGLAELEGVSGPDVTPPSGAVDATQPAPTLGQAEIRFTVTYTDDQALDVSTTAGANVRVTGPDGVPRTATFVSVASTSSKSATVTYGIPAPGGAVDVSDGGLYSVDLVGSPVKDAAGNAAATGSLGSFTLRLSPPNGPAAGAAVTGALPSSVVAGSRGTVTVVVTNGGNAALTGPVTITLLASQDQSADAGDVQITSVVKTLKLRPGQSKSVRVSFTYPGGLPDGPYFILSRVEFPGAGAAGSDPGLTAVASSASPVIIAAPFVDLTGSVAGALLAAQAKASVPIRVQNVGNITFKGTITVRLYASADQTIDAGDASVAVPVKLNLRAGAGKVQVLKFTPPALSPGTYFLIVSIDDANAVAEGNEVNNVFVGPMFTVP